MSRRFQAIEVFEALVKSGQSPTPEVYDIVSNAFVSLAVSGMVKRIAEQMLEQGLEPSALFTSNSAIAHANAKRIHRTMEEYNRFKNIKERPPGTIDFYETVAALFAEKGRLKLCSGVIEDMIEDGHKPSPRLTLQHFSGALDQSDETNLQRALMQWPDALGQLDKGTCTRALLIAARRGNVDLATQIWNLMTGPFGHAAPDPACYAAMAQCFGVAGDDESMLCCLMDMEARGVAAPPNLVRDVGLLLSSSVQRTDDAFYLLQALHKQQQQQQQQQAQQNESDGVAEDEGPLLRPMHVSALNALIHACALQPDGLDRAFATLESVSTEFGLEPDRLAYACILSACAAVEAAASGGTRGRPRKRSLASQRAGIAMALLEDMVALPHRQRRGENSGSPSSSPPSPPTPPLEESAAAAEEDSRAYGHVLVALERGGHGAQADELLERMGYQGVAVRDGTRHELARLRLARGAVVEAEALLVDLQRLGKRVPQDLYDQVVAAAQRAMSPHR